jgi:hypothetical protein
MPKYKVPNFGPQGRPNTFNSSTTLRGDVVPAGITPPIPLPHAGDLGVVYEEGVNRWQIFEVVDAQNGAAGDVLYVKSYAAYTATPTVGNSSGNEVAGIAELQYTTPSATVRVCVALRIGGVFSVKFTGTGAQASARGSVVIVDSVGTNSTDVDIIGTAPVAANENRQPIGIAQAAASGGFISTFLTIQPK